MEKTPETPHFGLEYREAAALSAEETLRRLASSLGGLAPAEARVRLAANGRNAFESRQKTALDIVVRQFKSPMTGLLVVAGAVALALGETLDGITIFVILSINVIIGFLQEYRSEKALAVLSEHLSPRARVRRGGVVMTIDRSEMVPGDVALLAPGDIAPADIRLTVAGNLVVDETVLTGESVNVGKSLPSVKADAPHQAADIVFMMSRIVSGAGEGVVVATAKSTVMGQAASLAEETVHVSAFEKNVAQLSAFLLKTVGLILLVVFAANIALKGVDQLVPQLLFAIAMAVSVIPEALPAITAITLSNGAMRLAKKHVVVKRLTSIEDLGHIEILCTDKTGTITQSVMAVQEVVGEAPEKLLIDGLLASAEDEFSDLKAPKTFGGALMVHAAEPVRKAFHATNRRWFIPFDPARRRTTAVADFGHETRLVTMGAAEAILPLCDMAVEARRHVEERVAAAGRRGWRVLVIGTKAVARREAYADADERGIRYAGFIAFADPLKGTAKKSIADARHLNVRVKILTGDSVEVAGAIGREVGILEDVSHVISGARLAEMSEEEFREAALGYDVFARVAPEQKYRIIQALQQDHQVGFLGEGINDAPALKLADVSLVVQSASDVAREAADIILLRKDLHVIIDGIRDGRAIFTNIVKYIKYTMIGNLGNFAAIAGISLVIDYLPMLPVQLLLVNLLTDLPLAAVASDTVDEEELRQPRHFNIKELAFAALFLGVVSSIFDFLYFASFRSNPSAVVQTGWFVFSILTELALIYSIRTRKPFFLARPPGRWLLGLSVAAAAAALIVPHTEIGVELFHFVPPTGTRLLVIPFLVVLYFLSTESVKLIYGKIFNNHRINPV
jgi:Mg2+-importing ATPase